MSLFPPPRRCGFTLSAVTPMVNRRTVLGALGAFAVGQWMLSGLARAQVRDPEFSYPMGVPGQPLGDGLLIRHGYATENVPYYPGWWHTGENWFFAGGKTFGL